MRAFKFGGGPASTSCPTPLWFLNRGRGSEAELRFCPRVQIPLRNQRRAPMPVREAFSGAAIILCPGNRPIHVADYIERYYSTTRILDAGLPIATGVIEGACPDVIRESNGNHRGAVEPRRRRGRSAVTFASRQRRPRRLLAAVNPTLTSKAQSVSPACRGAVDVSRLSFDGASIKGGRTHQICVVFLKTVSSTHP
jgi:hypothetical protein